MLHGFAVARRLLIAVIGYDGYLTNSTINGQIAQQQNGSTIVLEHRFYGLSNPFNNLSVASLQVHTIQQAIDDLAYFAQNVKLPMPNGDNVTPDKAPWVLIGGSYSGTSILLRYVVLSDDASQALLLVGQWSSE